MQLVLEGLGCDVRGGLVGAGETFTGRRLSALTVIDLQIHLRPARDRQSIMLVSHANGYILGEIVYRLCFIKRTR